MLEQVKAEWQTFRSAQAGERFLQHHERYQRREAPILNSILFFASVFCAGMSVVLPIVSEFTGLAFGFGAVALVLLPGESLHFAQLLDKLEALVSGRATGRPSAARAEQQLPRAEPPPPPRAEPPPPRADQQTVRVKPARPTVRVSLPTREGQFPAVLTARPIIVADMPRKPRVRSRVTPATVAGTLKIWSPTAPPQPSAATNVTIVMFPPPARDES